MPPSIPQDKQAAIAEGLINGQTQMQIAESLQVDQKTVSNYSRKPDIKAIVESCYNELITNSAQKAAENYRLTIQRANQVLSETTPDPETGKPVPAHDAEKHKTLLNLSHRKETLALQGIGILPTNTQSPVTVNILNQVNHVYSDTTLRIVDKYTDDMAAMDVDFEVNDCGKTQSATPELPEPQGKLSGNSAHTSKTEDNQ